MALVIESSEKVKQYARVCLWGTAKSGKTHTALVLATAMAGEGKVGVISSEYGSSKLLARQFPHDIVDLAKVDETGKQVKNPFTAARYEEALRLFLNAGYKAIIIDSLSHAWAGEGGILQAVDSSKNSFSDGWKDNTPVYDHLLGAILGAKCHVIVTLRAKDAYVMEEYTKRDGAKGTMPKNAGLAPVMRKGFGFEMQLTLRMDSLTAYVEASGVEEYVHKGEEIERPGPELAYRLLEALDGVELPEPTMQEQAMQRHFAAFQQLYPRYCAQTPNWQHLLLKQALTLPEGETLPAPSAYTDDDVARVDLFIAEKKRNAESKRHGQAAKEPSAA